MKLLGYPMEAYMALLNMLEVVCDTLAFSVYFGTDSVCTD